MLYRKRGKDEKEREIQKFKAYLWQEFCAIQYVVVNNLACVMLYDGMYDTPFILPKVNSPHWIVMPFKTHQGSVCLKTPQARY